MKKILMAAMAACILAGCGGGGDDDEGGTAKCKDGWVTPSAGKQGACSSHGGLA